MTTLRARCSRSSLLLALVTLVGLATAAACRGVPVTSYSRADVQASLAAAGPLPADTMRVHMIDVGQGAAMLVEFPCAAILIDTGGEDNQGFHSTPLLENYLDAFFASRPDLEGRLALLLITHPHIDHTRGAAMVASRYQVDNLVTDGFVRDDLGGAEQTALWERAGEKKVPRFAARAAKIPAGGLENPIVDPVVCGAVDPRIRVLWGGVSEQEVDWNHYWMENLNNHSVVVRIDLGESSLLVSGDLQVPGLKALVEKHAGTDALDADVYQVGHHGAFNGVTDEFLAAVSPEVALIPCGGAEREVPWSAWKYGHPRLAIVEKLVKVVTGKRRMKRVRVAEKVEKFLEMPIYKAVYASGWDGSVIVDMHADGTNRVWTQK